MDQTEGHARIKGAAWGFTANRTFCLLSNIDRAKTRIKNLHVFQKNLILKDLAPR
jgi:hypothetical protein